MAETDGVMVRGTREWAVAEISCCIGCTYGCRYCYARAKALKKGLIASAAEWQGCRIVEEDVCRKYPRFSGQVMFPATHDIIPENLESCVKVIRSLLCGGNRVLIVSKPTPESIAIICDTFAKYREQILFRFTITSRNDNILTFWEPGAPSYVERLEALRVAYSRGFATSVSIEPMLEAIDITGLTAELAPLVSHSIWIGKMNRIEERVTIDSPEIITEIDRLECGQGNDEIIHIYQVLKENPIIRWKESVKEIVGLPQVKEAGLDI